MANDQRTPFQGGDVVVRICQLQLQLHLCRGKASSAGAVRCLVRPTDICVLGDQYHTSFYHHREHFLQLRC